MPSNGPGLVRLLAVALITGLLAVVGDLLATAAGLPGSYGLVVGIALATPAVALATSVTSDRFDAPAYRREGMTRRTLDALAVVAVAAVAGSVAVAVTGVLSLGTAVETGAGVGVAFLTGLYTFRWRTRAFTHDPDGTGASEDANADG